VTLPVIVLAGAVFAASEKPAAPLARERADETPSRQAAVVHAGGKIGAPPA
jgi:hypothetical protein